MSVYEQLLEVLQGREGEVFSAKEIKDLVQQRFGRGRDSVIPSDYCYNRTNKAITFDKHILEWLGRGQYRYLGENYRYSGTIVWKPQGETEETIVGEWRNGQLHWREDPSATRKV